MFSIFHHSCHFSHSFSSIKQKVNHKKENHQNQNFVILNTENSTSPRRQNQRKNWTRHFLISQASQPKLPIKKINTKKMGIKLIKSKNRRKVQIEQPNRKVFWEVFYWKMWTRRKIPNWRWLKRSEPSNIKEEEE